MLFSEENWRECSHPDTAGWWGQSWQTLTFKGKVHRRWLELDKQLSSTWSGSIDLRIFRKRSASNRCGRLSCHPVMQHIKMKNLRSISEKWMKVRSRFIIIAICGAQIVLQLSLPSFYTAFIKTWQKWHIWRLTGAVNPAYQATKWCQKVMHLGSTTITPGMLLAYWLLLSSTTAGRLAASAADML